MIRKSTRVRTLLLRSALAGALVLAGTAALPAAAMAKEAAPAAKYSDKFVPVFTNGQKVLAAAKARPDVIAAQAKVKAAQGDAQDAAIAELAKLLTSERATMDGVIAAAQTPDDKHVAGQLMLQFGGITMDQATQSIGLETMLASGRVAPADQGKFEYYVGSIAYEHKDYARARTHLAAAAAAGFKDNQTELLLADSYFRDSQTAAGIDVLARVLREHAAAGQPAPENWYKLGLGAAYRAKLIDKAAELGSLFVTAYPTKEYWAGAISVVRDIGHFAAPEELDLMRLMARTHSYQEKADYLAYIFALGTKNAPAEALSIVNEAFASGKVEAGNTTLTEARNLATSRLAADKASLPALERDARAANAPTVLVSNAGDAFLSYGDTARAISLYQLALTKPGADSGRILTRMGIAQVDAGAYADALASFAKVDGPRKPIAKLWMTYTQAKATPPAPAAPAAPAAK